MSMPRLGGHGYGVCSLVPKGLSVLKQFPDDKVSELLRVIGEDSVTGKDLAKQAAKPPKQTKKIEKGTSGGGRGSRGRGAEAREMVLQLLNHHQVGRRRHFQWRTWTCHRIWI